MLPIKFTWGTPWKIQTSEEYSKPAILKAFSYSFARWVFGQRILFFSFFFDQTGNHISLTDLIQLQPGNPDSAPITAKANAWQNVCVTVSELEHDSSFHISRGLCHAGKFFVNKHLSCKLKTLGLWNWWENKTRDRLFCAPLGPFLMPLTNSWCITVDKQTPQNINHTTVLQPCL